MPCLSSIIATGSVGVNLSLVLVVIEIGFLFLLLPVARVLVGCLEIHLAVVIAVVLVPAQVAVEIPSARVDGLLAVLVTDGDLGNGLIGDVGLFG